MVDIGANIGISAVYLATLFPHARVLAFEPSPDNLALLERNTKPLQRVQALPIALGERDGTLEFFSSEAAANFGGFSRFEAGSDATRKTAVPVRHAGRQLAELGITGDEFLSRTKYISGELHGHRDFELLAMLSRHFHIAVRKRLRDRLFMFQALDRSLQP